MSAATLIRLGGLAAMLAGALRMAASFIPYSSASVQLELLYLVIDLLLLLGLLGIYAYQHEQAGKLGFAGFLPALIGTASIVGPDGKLGNVDMYVAGSLLISLGLCVFSIGIWRARMLPRAVPLLWIASTVIGIGGFLVNGPPVTFLLAGVTFGLGFVLAGSKIWSDPALRK